MESARRTADVARPEDVLPPLLVRGARIKLPDAMKDGAAARRRDHGHSLRGHERAGRAGHYCAVMAVSVVFETHSWSEDNDRGVATGWLGGRLSTRGRALAGELGERRHGDGLDAVVCSDLARARETVELAFRGLWVPLFYDWRLRECDYGVLNGAAAAQVLGQRSARLDVPYPGGESWHDAVERNLEALRDVARRWDGRRVLIIGHVATRWALDLATSQVDLPELVVADFGWRAGWEYQLASPLVVEGRVQDPRDCGRVRSCRRSGN